MRTQADKTASEAIEIARLEGAEIAFAEAVRVLRNYGPREAQIKLRELCEDAEAKRREIECA